MSATSRTSGARARATPSIAIGGDTAFPILLFLGIALVLVIVAWLSVAYLPFSSVPKSTGPRWRSFPHAPWFDGWARFDGGWYASIATHGYSFTGPNGQSPTAFFPGYPLVMRAVDKVTRNVMLAGMLTTFVCGLGSAVAFSRWVRERLGEPAARYGLAALLLYPFAYYLVGAVYGDALFLLMAVVAFLLVEHDEPLLAGLAGACATATRPVGGALVLGLLVRALERRGVFDHARAAGSRWARVRLRDLGVLLSAGGLLAYCVYLWARFGDPLAFANAMEGWKQPEGVSTWLKLDVWRAFAHPFSSYLARSLVHAGLTVGALALVPRVRRRLGWGYATYVFAIVFFPALATKDFVGMARYVLAAFPCFAVIGDWIAERPVPARWLLTGSALSLVVLTSFYARWNYLS